MAGASDATESDMEEASSTTNSSSSNARLSFHIEQERSLPGIVIASGGQVFTMLYQLSEIDDFKYVLRLYLLERILVKCVNFAQLIL